MRTRQILLLSGVLIFAACQDRTAAPLAPEAAPPEEPQLTFGTPQYDGANAAPVDQYGNVYVAGRTDGSLKGPTRV